MLKNNKNDKNLSKHIKKPVPYASGFLFITQASK